ncbi:malonyl CoA-ACP transacylase [Cystobacter fuscus]|uniref:Malonyl CoA-ACP transacylase n=1 Tax=Cystobacter fuscus TaxID=43 RepID=A0A250J9A8_9BACT|nr:thioesterase domain-containing protein [Cystobacter fuscus]ATB40494.1 malonyl CoA-ACP transacylase [Cystobacter fuscus]
MNPESRPPPATTPWLVRRKPSASPRLRLFCFPYAGAGSLPYYKWPDLLPSDIEVCALQYPGRESRLREPLFTALPQLTAKLIEVLSPFLDGEYAFFGHSLGSLVAFDLIRELRRQGRPLPRLFFASGSAAPSYRSQLPPFSHFGRDDFIRELSTRYGGLPLQILEQPELLELILPTLRADVKVSESYVHREEPPLSVRICAFGGSGDPHVTEASLAAWGQETQHSFTMQMFSGGHFFINEVPDQVLQIIRDELTTRSHPRPMTKTQLLADLTRYVAEEILEGAAEDLEPSTPLLELGILNSLETTRMMAFIQKQYGITVPADAIRVEDLQTLSAITDLVYGIHTRKP